MILFGKPNLGLWAHWSVPTGIKKCKFNKQSQIYKAAEPLAFPDFHNKVPIYVCSIMGENQGNHITIKMFHTVIRPGCHRKRTLPKTYYENVLTENLHIFITV